MVVASYVAYRHSRWWPVVGGAAGGAIIGGVFKLLGIDILTALFGQNPDGIAGSLEGALLGHPDGSLVNSRAAAGAGKPRRVGGGGPGFRLPQRPGGKSWFPLAVGAILAVWLGLSMVHQVGPKEEGIVTTFGPNWQPTRAFSPTASSSPP